MKTKQHILNIVAYRFFTCELYNRLPETEFTVRSSHFITYEYAAKLFTRRKNFRAQFPAIPSWLVPLLVRFFSMSSASRSCSFTATNREWGRIFAKNFNAFDTYISSILMAKTKI